MMLLTKTDVEILAESILEVIDTKLAPLIEKVAKIERQERIGQPELEVFRESLKPNFQIVSSDITKTIEALAALKNETGKKFHITAKILVPLMWVLRKESGADICAADIEGLAFLMGEPIPKTEGLSKEQLNDLFEKIWKEHKVF